MKTIFKIGFNAILLTMFLGMLVLPAGFMGVMDFEEDSNVLSAQDSIYEESSVKSINNSEIPFDVEEMILKMETEYYKRQQEQQDEFVGDIDRTEEVESLNNKSAETEEETSEENIKTPETN